MVLICLVFNSRPLLLLVWTFTLHYAVGWLVPSYSIERFSDQLYLVVFVYFFNGEEHYYSDVSKRFCPYSSKICEAYVVCSNGVGRIPRFGPSTYFGVALLPSSKLVASTGPDSCRN